MQYSQLTQGQRYQIYSLLKLEHTQTEIAECIGVHKSTISRELRRNRGQRGYRPKQAQEKTKDQRVHKVHTKISSETWHRVEEKPQIEWSPEQITDWLHSYQLPLVSPEWIYQYIYADKRAGGTLHKHLRGHTCPECGARGRNGENDMANMIAGA